MTVLSFFLKKSNWTYMREKSVVAYQISELQSFFQISEPIDQITKQVFDTF